MFGKQGGSYIHIHPSSLHLIQQPDKNITEGEESCVKTSKGCVIDHDQDTMIDSNDDDELTDEESDEVNYSNEEGNSESLEDTQDDFEEIHKDKNQKIQGILNAENPDNSFNNAEERNPVILRNEPPQEKAILSAK